GEAHESDLIPILPGALEAEPSPDQRQRDREARERAERERDMGEPAQAPTAGDEALGREILGCAPDGARQAPRVAQRRKRRPRVHGRGRPAPERARAMDDAEGRHEGRPEIAEEGRVEVHFPGGAEVDGPRQRSRDEARVTRRPAHRQAAHDATSSRRPHGSARASSSAGGSFTKTSPSRTTTGNVAIRYCGSERPAPVSSENVRLCSGQATFGASPCGPRSPRPRTLSLRCGQVAWVAYHVLRLAKLNTAIWTSPWRIVTPPSGGTSSMRATRTHAAVSSSTAGGGGGVGSGQSAGRFCPRSRTNGRVSAGASLVVKRGEGLWWSGSPTPPSPSHPAEAERATQSPSRRAAGP